MENLIETVLKNDYRKLMMKIPKEMLKEIEDEYFISFKSRHNNQVSSGKISKGNLKKSDN